VVLLRSGRIRLAVRGGCAADGGLEQRTAGCMDVRRPAEAAAIRVLGAEFDGAIRIPDHRPHAGRGKVHITGDDLGA
ncbi:MAG: hypothetical protein ACK55I_44110, partial [bacterium]